MVFSLSETETPVSNICMHIIDGNVVGYENANAYTQANHQELKSIWQAYKGSGHSVPFKVFKDEINRAFNHAKNLHNSSTDGSTPDDIDELRDRINRYKGAINFCIHNSFPAGNALP